MYTDENKILNLKTSMTEIGEDEVEMESPCHLK